MTEIKNNDWMETEMVNIPSRQDQDKELRNVIRILSAALIATAIVLAISL